MVYINSAINDLTSKVVNQASKSVSQQSNPLSLGLMNPRYNNSSVASLPSIDLGVSSPSAGATPSDHDSDLFSYLASIVPDLVHNLGSGEFSFNDDGTVNYGSNWFEKNVLKGQYNQNMLYMNSYNNAWKLANRQQDLAENAVLNQARQLQQLGINPASVGQSLATASGSGGTSPSVSQPSVSGESNALGLLTVLLDYKLKNRELGIAERNADTNEFNAATSRIDTNISSRRANAEIALSNANRDKVMTEAEWQRLQNTDLGLSNSQLHILGLSRSTISSFANLSVFTATTLGVTSLVGNIVDEIDASGVTEQAKEDAALVNEIVSDFNNLSDVQKAGFYQFFEDYPEASRRNKTIPVEQIKDWNNRNTSSYQIYRWLEDYYNL